MHHPRATKSQQRRGENILEAIRQLSKHPAIIEAWQHVTQLLQQPPDLPPLEEQAVIIGHAVSREEATQRIFAHFPAVAHQHAALVATLNDLCDLVEHHAPDWLKTMGKYLPGWTIQQVYASAGYPPPMPIEERFQYFSPGNPIECLAEDIYYIPITTTKTNLLELGAYLIALRPAKRPGPETHAKQQKPRPSPLDPARAALAYQLAQPGVPKRLIVQRLFPSVALNDRKAYDAARGKVKRLIDFGARLAKQPLPSEKKMRRPCIFLDAENTAQILTPSSIPPSPATL